MATTERSTTLQPAAARSTHLALQVMVVGLLLTLVAAVVPIVDQLTVHGLATHLRAVYAGTGVPAPAASGLVIYLVVLGALGILSWLVTIQAVRRRRRWARPVATGLFVVASVLAVVDLTVSEYGTEPILPLWLGVAGLLPCLAGLVAVALLWRRTDGSLRGVRTGRRGDDGDVSAGRAPKRG